MKIKLWCDSSANICSKRLEIIDLMDWNISDFEWQLTPETERTQLIMDWAEERLDIGYEELDDEV